LKETSAQSLLMIVASHFTCLLFYGLGARFPYFSNKTFFSAACECY